MTLTIIDQLRSLQLYEILDTIMPNRLSPITNLLTNELQRAYRHNISTQDIIHVVKPKLSAEKYTAKSYHPSLNPLIQLIDDTMVDPIHKTTTVTDHKNDHRMT